MVDTSMMGESNSDRVSKDEVEKSIEETSRFS